MLETGHPEQTQFFHDLKTNACTNYRNSGMVERAGASELDSNLRSHATFPQQTLGKVFKPFVCFRGLNSLPCKDILPWVKEKVTTEHLAQLLDQWHMLWAGALVSLDCQNDFPPSGRLQITEFILTVLEVRSKKSKGQQDCIHLWKLQKGSPYLPPQFLMALMFLDLQLHTPVSALLFLKINLINYF